LIAFLVISPNLQADFTLIFDPAPFNRPTEVFPVLGLNKNTWFQKKQSIISGGVRLGRVVITALDFVAGRSVVVYIRFVSVNQSKGDTAYVP
jgi:hypothetical protein